MLNAEQIARYHRDGYVVPDFRVPDETLASIREDHAGLIARHPRFADYCPTVLAYDVGFLEYARIPAILDMVEQIVGPDIALWNSSFFAKPAPRQAHALAPGRRVLADPAARDLHGVDRARRFDDRERLPARHSRARITARNCALTATIGQDVALNQELDTAEYDEANAVDLVLEAGQIRCTISSWCTAPSPTGRRTRAAA